MALFDCCFAWPGKGIGETQAQADIVPEGVELHIDKRRVFVPFMDLMDMRLINYRLHLILRDGEAIVSKLGYHTEEFFEKLWLDYAQSSLEALFVEDKAQIACEGDYGYQEGSLERASIAKLELHDDSLCILPHDVGSRRVPLVFSKPPIREGFSLSLALDTGECYRFSRLGKNTDPLFDRIMSLRAKDVSAWKAAHERLARDIDARLGEAQGQYRSFAELGTSVFQGLFSADDESFWFAAVSNGRAAVELVSEEQTATYLYRFSEGADTFVLSLRHAMEAVKRHRRLIFISDEDLQKEPLFVMAQDRSSYVRFLRSCNVGRIIHATNWETRLKEFFA